MPFKDLVKDEIKSRVVGEDWDSPKVKDLMIKKVISPEITKTINYFVNDIRNDINNKLEENFNKSTRDLLSDAVLKVLSTNDVYSKMQENVKQLADKNKDIT